MGQRHSTFPWADTASALYEHAGRCWLASEIAIIGAATDHRLGYTRKPGLSGFGSTGHPCELLAQTRTNAGNAGWWRDQLSTLDDDLGRAEWLLALTSVAGTSVRSELRHEAESVRVELSEPRLRVVDRAAEWLRRPVRRAADLPAAVDRLPQPMHFTSAPAPLLDVARSRHWLKVDATPLYR